MSLPASLHLIFVFARRNAAPPPLDLGKSKKHAAAACIVDVKRSSKSNAGEDDSPKSKKCKDKKRKLAADVSDADAAKQEKKKAKKLK